MANQLIIENEPVFIIHQRPYSETSQILNLFSKNYGRVDVIAKGSKRPKSKFRSFMQPFMPLSASWSGRSQLKTSSQVAGSSRLNGIRMASSKSARHAGSSEVSRIGRRTSNRQTHPLLPVRVFV